jgi:predicted  nucleic acid-binding Zn-ribbon protein
VEIIAELEDELKALKARKPDGDSRTELEELRQQVAAKNEAIAQLQRDADEQQRKLAKLRTSEVHNHTLTQTLTQQSQSRIEELEREIDLLQTANAELSKTAEGWRRKYEFMSTEAPSAYKTAGEK